MSSAVHAVANEIRRRLLGVPKVKLHKLLYYAQGHHLAAFGTPLFDETISAWDMGPVVGQYWFAERNGVLDDPGDESLTEAELNTVGYVLSRYGGLTGRDLIQLSHSEPPWRDADARRLPNTSARIEQDAIRAYFLTVVAESDDAEPLFDADDLAKFLSGAEARFDTPRHVDSPDALAERRAQLLA